MFDLKNALADVVGFMVSMGDISSDVLLSALGLGHVSEATVALLVGDLSVSETLDYARLLLEQGRPVEAEELALAALGAAAGVLAQQVHLRWASWGRAVGEA
jgi:hypothetical protein